MNCYGAFLFTLSLLQGFIVQGLPQETTATEAESLEPTAHSGSPAVSWYYPGASVEVWTPGISSGVAYNYPASGVVYPSMSGVYPSGYPSGSYPVYPSAGYPRGSYPTYPAGGYPVPGTGYPGIGAGYPGTGAGYPGTGAGYPGSGGGYPGTGAGYPGSGRAYPGSGSGIVPPTGTDNGKIPGGVPVNDEVEIFTVPRGRGGYSRLQREHKATHERR